MLIVAHRGLHARRPENSAAAVQAAVDAGLTRIEVDVRSTADGHLVLMHDASIGRTTSGEGPLAALRAHELGSIRLPDGSPVPSLFEVLEICRGRAVLCADVKEPDLGPAVIAAAERVGTAIEVWSSHREVVAHTADQGEFAAWISHGLMPADGVEALVDEALQLGASALSFFPADLTPTVAAVCREAEIPVMSGTPNDRLTWEYLRRQEVRAVITDRPVECLAWSRTAHAPIA